MLIAIDFGRIYLGYINLQQIARVGANYAAEHARAWDTPGDTDDQATYQAMIANEAALINCDLQDDGSGNVPDPAFPGGFEIGDPVEIRLNCTFSVLTPVISGIVGSDVLVSASSVYPVKEGAVASVPGGGGGAPVPAPTADFIGSPQTGYAPLEVTFTDLSTGSPTSWNWNFGNGTSFTQGPHVRTYDCAGSPGDTCTFTVRLDVGNAGGFSTKSEPDYITVTVPPDSGPVAEFEATPRFGEDPLSVSASFVEVTSGVVYTDWEWDFDGGGAIDDTGQSASHTYPDPGLYDVTLTVTDDTGATNSQTKTVYVVVSERICTVPDFVNVRRTSAQALWAAAGFSTNVTFMAGQGNYRIQQQTLTGGTINPQPDGCDSQITVGP